MAKDRDSNERLALLARSPPTALGRRAARRRAHSEASKQASSQAGTGPPPPGRRRCSRRTDLHQGRMRAVDDDDDDDANVTDANMNCYHRKEERERAIIRVSKRKQQTTNWN